MHALASSPAPHPAAVDEAHFYAAHAAHSGDLNSISLGAIALPDAYPPHALRACTAILLCVGSRLRNAVAAAVHYISEARSHIGASAVSEPPSQLLVSALLVLALVTSDGITRDGEAARHAAHAYSLAAMLAPGSLRADIRFAVNAIRHMHTSIGRGVSWPPAVAPIGEHESRLTCSCPVFIIRRSKRAGTDKLSRFIEVQPFIVTQLLPRNFADVPPEHTVRMEAG